MKKIFYVFLLSGFILGACGGGQEQASGESDEAAAAEQEAVKEDEQSIKSCDEFLDEYDKWTDEYLKVVKAYLEDPTNTQLSQDYIKLTESLSTWYTDWSGYMQCATKEEYQKRFQEIGEKVEKGLEELGLED